LRRKLLVLNIVLAGVVVYAGVRFRREWVAAKLREHAALDRYVPPVPPPKFTPAPLEPPIMPSGYADVANKMLFDKSRNPVVVEVVAPPPPPPPMPPLPLYHGMMNLGSDGPTLFFSLGGGAPHQAVHPGETIGQFKLVSVNTDEITLEWDGKEIHKSFDELSDAAKSAPRQDEPAGSRTVAPAAASAAPAPPPRSGPGEDTGRGFRACSMNDGVADGGVVDGYRKVSYPTPFGQSCRYEPVK
jgi:hypothetical protein